MTRQTSTGVGNNRAGVQHVGVDCNGPDVKRGGPTAFAGFFVGPENGVLEIELLPPSEFVQETVVGSGSTRRDHLFPKPFTELRAGYEAAAAAAATAGTLITQRDIFHPGQLSGFRWTRACKETDLRYCPKYLVGTVNKIHLTVTNRDPAILHQGREQRGGGGSADAPS